MGKRKNAAKGKTTESLTTESPTTESSTTEATASEASITETSTTESPTTESPTTESPTTESPTTEAPTSEASITETSTTESPTTESPTTESPTTESPTTESPTTESPPKESPSTEEKDSGDITNKISDITNGPEIAKLTEADKQLPYEEKLKLIEEEAKTLYEYTLLKGFSSKQIRSCMSPLIGNETSFIKRCLTGSSKSALILVAVIAVVCGLMRNTSSKNMILIHGKLLMLQTIYVWNWTDLYNQECVIENTFLPQKNFTKQDCFPCIEFAEQGGKIEKMENVKAKDITDNYLSQDYPFLVTDAVKDWPKDESGKLNLRLEKFNEMFQKHPILVDGSHGCEFFSTLDEHKNLSSFVGALATGSFPKQFNVAWDNCDVRAAKVFRSITKRPYFIPPMAQSSSTNQIVIAKGKFVEEDFMPPQNVDSASFMIVLQGEITVTLKPIDMCSSFKCKESTFKVTKGQAVVVPTRVWELMYRPTAKRYTMAFASTLLWDEG